MGEREEAEVVEVVDLGVDGEGVARSRRGLVLFLPGATLGDQVEVVVPPGRRNMARVEDFRIVRPSRLRVEPPCPHFGRCGGCDLQNLPYDEELRWKERRVRETIRRIGKLSPLVLPVEAAPDPYHYRHKVAMPLGGPPARLGLYARGSHEVAGGVDCLVLRHTLLECLEALEAELRLADFTPEEIPYVVARASYARGDVLLTLVARRSPAKEVAAWARLRLPGRLPHLASLWLSVREEETNRVLSPRLVHLALDERLEDEFLGLSLRLGPEDFFQVHPAMAERLFGRLVASVPRGRRILDLYTGVGVSALLLGPFAEEVVGVEAVPAQVEEAVASARRNARENVRFVAGRVEDVLPELPEAEVAVLDPPRRGAPGVAQALREKGVREVWYISCDPATLARDAGEFAQAGFTLETVEPFDMFPRTVHVESLAHFRRP